MKEKIKIGIDLGTTNTVVCYENNNGEYDFLKFGIEKLLPSVLYVDNDVISVGTFAKKKGSICPQRYIKSSKTHIGEFGFVYPDSVKGMDFGNSNIRITPTDAAGHILSEVKKVLIKKIPGAAEADIDAVITIPAYFNINQAEETEKAGKIAGLNVKMTLSEPVAAAIAYVTENIEDSTKIFVVDFGGGTLDITLLSYNAVGNRYDVIAKAGDNKLGGDNIDECLVKMFTEIIRQDTGIDLTSLETSKLNSSEYYEIMSKLGTAATQTKESLSDNDDHDVDIPALLTYKNRPYDFEPNISVDEFNEACKPVFDRVRSLIDKMIKERNINVDEINKILLVGGSCYIPKVREIVTEYFGREVDYDLDLSKVVALGACIVANQELEDAEGKSFISEMNAHDFGVEAVEVKTGKTHFSTIIERNTPVPCAFEREYKTSSNDPLMINVYERNANVPSSDDRIESCDFFGSLLFDDFKKDIKGGAVVSIKFDFDAQKRLKVSVTDKSTGRKTETHLEKNAKLQIKKSSTKPMEIFLLIDTSGSMESDLESVKDACKKLIDTIDLKQSKIGIIQFKGRGQSSVVSELSSNGNQLKESLYRLDAYGGTAVAEAFKKADERFRYSADHRSVVIMLTDGEVRDTDEAVDIARSMKNKGTEIISIGANSEYDKDFLRRISAEKGGVKEVYEIKNMSMLTETFETIANSLQEM